MFETSVDSIISVFQKTIEKLETHAVNMIEKQVNAEIKVQEAKEQVANCVSEVNRATTIARKLKEVVS